MPSIFGDLFTDQWPDTFLKRATTPHVNVIECDKKYKIEIAAPGMTKDDLKIDLTTDNQLIVSLEKSIDEGDKSADKEDNSHYLRREFYYTSFRQVFNIPDTVDRDNIKAKMKHGVLHIKLPKRDGAETLPEPKHIAIE